MPLTHAPDIADVSLCMSRMAHRVCPSPNPMGAYIGMGLVVASGLNDKGRVAGTAFFADGSRAFYTGVNGAGLTYVSGLPDGIFGSDARNINNVGQILASGSDGHSHLLTPMAIPEPATWALWMLGLVGIASKRQRH